MRSILANFIKIFAALRGISLLKNNNTTGVLGQVMARKAAIRDRTKYGATIATAKYRIRARTGPIDGAPNSWSTQSPALLG